jgi:hypothetical protein
MTKIQQIVDLLNELIVKQPDIITLFHAGVLATEETKEMTSIMCRVDKDDQDWVTGAGIISAIGRILGSEEGTDIRSVWDGEGADWHLVKFVVGESQNDQSN